MNDSQIMRAIQFGAQAAQLCVTLTLSRHTTASISELRQD